MALDMHTDRSSPFSTPSSPLSSPSKPDIVAAAAPIPIVVDDDDDVPPANPPPSPPKRARFSPDNISIIQINNPPKHDEKNPNNDENLKAEVQPASPPNPDSAAASSSLAPTTTTTKPPSSSNSATSAHAKPKSTKSAKHRSPSPSPPPPPQRRLQTIRLEIKLGGPDAYDVNISQLAKATGQRQPTPPPPVSKKAESSDSEEEDEDGKPKSKKGKGKDGKKKRSLRNYDLNDPFIDDSELAIDQRQFYAQTKQQGFYVSSGEVALLKEKSPKKPKSKRIIPTIIPLATTTNTAPISSASGSALPPTQQQQPPRDTLGTPDSPIVLLSDNETQQETAGSGSGAGVSAILKRKASTDSASTQQNGGAKKKRKTVDIEDFHPDLQRELNRLKDAISRESFEQKGKFPPNLKPVLAAAALQAIRCGEYNDKFFSLMPKLFIYNKFTMTKLIKRTVYYDHVTLLTERQAVLLKELEDLAFEGFPKAKEEYEKALAQWEKRREKKLAEAQPGATSTEGTPVPASTSGQNGGPPSNADDGESEQEGQEHDAPTSTQGGKGKDANPPVMKYKMTERMKMIIWELVLLSNESCKIENEKATYEGSTMTLSEQGARKNLYQKIVSAFPSDWMSSGYISREVSVMKKRFEAQQQDD